MYIFIIFALIFQVRTASICDVHSCVCRLNNKGNDDFKGENVDCSYRDENILRSNYTLPTRVFSLDLSSSNLSRVHPSGLLQSKTMIELYLNNNKITLISTDALQLPELKKLDMSNNLLEFVDKSTFRGINNLEYLNLANNRFGTFEKLTFHHLRNLQEVVLDNNNLGPSLQETDLFDRDGFGLTNKIKSISIKGINLNTVQDNFFVDAYDIRKLIISDNNLTEIFELPFTLEYLDLSDNPITEITMEDFIDLPGLKALKLNNLAITEVPEGVFTPLHSLTNLELERNINLTQFSTLAFGQEVLDDAEGFTLETLSLKGSRLSKLDGELIEPFGQLLRLDLQGNPWNCDCKLVWLKKLQIAENDYNHLRCATPKEFFNARIFDLKAKYFACQVQKRHLSAVIAISSVCALLAIIAIWLFICLPKHQSRSDAIRQMYTPSTAYSVLPITANVSDL